MKRLFILALAFSTVLMSTGALAGKKGLYLDEILDNLDSAKSELSAEQFATKVASSLNKIKNVNDRHQVAILLSSGFELRAGKETIGLALANTQAGMIKILTDIQQGLDELSAEDRAEALSSKENLISEAKSILEDREYGEDASNMFPAYLVTLLKLEAFSNIPAIVTAMKQQMIDPNAADKMTAQEQQGILMIGALTYPVIAGEKGLLQLEKNLNTFWKAFSN